MSSTLPDDIEANIWLVDAADLVGGKLYVLGGGWSGAVVVEPQLALTVASVLAVPWHMTNRTLNLLLELLSEDGVTVQTDEGEPVEARGELQVGRPPDARPGTFQNVPFITPFKPFSIAAGGYIFVLSIDGTPLARARFQVRRRDA
jgi:hypothetical protein